MDKHKKKIKPGLERKIDNGCTLFPSFSTMECFENWSANVKSTIPALTNIMDNSFPHEQILFLRQKPSNTFASNVPCRIGHY